MSTWGHGSALTTWTALGERSRRRCETHVTLTRTTADCSAPAGVSCDGLTVFRHDRGGGIRLHVRRRDGGRGVTQAANGALARAEDRSLTT